MSDFYDVLVNIIADFLPRELQERAMYSRQTVKDIKNHGQVTLESGKEATVLNNGSVEVGHSYLTIKTQDSSLWVWVPFFHGQEAITATALAAISSGGNWWITVPTVAYASDEPHKYAVYMQNAWGISGTITLRVQQLCLRVVSSPSSGSDWSVGDNISIDAELLAGGISGTCTSRVPTAGAPGYYTYIFSAPVNAAPSGTSPWGDLIIPVDVEPPPLQEQYRFPSIDTSDIAINTGVYDTLLDYQYLVPSGA